MPSDGRYLYNQAGMQNTNYDYSAYPPPPPSSYDNSQLAQPQSRPMRPAPTSQPQSPHQPYNPPPPAYPPSYGPGPYMTHPPQHSQWSGDNWAHYNQNYAHPPQPQPQPPPPPPPSEGPYNPVPGRPEAVPSSSAEPRGYGTSNQPDPRRIEERQPPPISNPPPQPTARRREHESPPAASPGTPTGLDFMKLLESYRIILEANNSSGPGRPPPAETFERMVQSATYGAQMLESATFQQKTPPSEVTRSPMRKEPEEGIEAPDATVATAPKPQKQEEGPAQEGQSCKGCNATSTPEWRRGPLGPRTLCNACGLVYAKLLKKRVREGGGGPSNGAEAGSHGALDDSGEGESDDDDDEYGSQDRRSEGGRE